MDRPCILPTADRTDATRHIMARIITDLITGMAITEMVIITTIGHTDTIGSLN